MGVFDKIKNSFVNNDEEEYEGLYEDGTADYVDVASERRNREVNIRATTSLQIVLARPNDFSEVKSIGSDLNEQKTVLLNLENVKDADAKRILDFLSGVAFANGADIKMMAQKTFAIMPKNVGFSGVDLMSELESNGYSF